MTKKRLFLGLAAGLTVIAVAAVFLDPTLVLRGLLRREAFYRGRPVSYWKTGLKSQDPKVQSETTRTLKEGNDAAVPVLVLLLNEQSGSAWESAEVRWRAADILGQLGGQAGDAAPALIEALKDHDTHVRTVVATSLGALVPLPAEAVSQLITVLEIGDQSSTAAATTLSLFGAQAQTAVPALCAALKAKDSELRLNAARTLGKIGPKAAKAVPALVAGLKDDHPKVREHCAESLGDIGPSAGVAVPDLIAVLNDSEARVRRDAARSLGQIGPPAKPAVPMLEKLLSDKNPDVRKAAEGSLRMLAARDSGNASK
jgi:HEAT repeat protein